MRCRCTWCAGRASRYRTPWRSDALPVRTAASPPRPPIPGPPPIGGPPGAAARATGTAAGSAAAPTHRHAAARTTRPAAASRHLGRPARAVATWAAHCGTTHAVRPHAASAEAPIVLLRQAGSRAQAALHDERIGGALVEVGNLLRLDRAFVGDGARGGRLG